MIGIRLAFCQDGNGIGAAQKDQNDYLPPAPTAAALGKYVDQPVNLYMGIPEISIPIYEIDLGDYKLPIALSYHAGGFRVSECASWVGLGWSITGIGVINHSIQGLDDLDQASPKSYLAFRQTEGGQNVQHLQPDSEADYPSLTAIARRDIDPAPDLYIYSMGNLSGKFILTGNNTYTLHPIKPIQVEYPQVLQPQDFRITDEAGVKFHFGVKEWSTGRSQMSVSQFISSYYIDNITTPTNKKIDFTYVPTFFQQSLTLGGSVVYERSQAMITFSKGAPSVSPFAQYVDGQAVSMISWDEGTIEFVSDTIRQDVVGDRRLTGVTVRNKNGKIIKQLQFAYDYFNPGGTGPLDKRLKLLSVTEKNLDGGQDGVYDFTYNESTNLPIRTSPAIDHWGYFNGQTRNADAIPDMDPYGTMDYSKRTTNPATVSANILTKIVYPTKGSTTFEYEANQTAPTTASQMVTHNVLVSAPVINPVDGTQKTQTTFPFTVTDGFQLLNLTVTTVQPENIGSNSHAFVALYMEGVPTPIQVLANIESRTEQFSFTSQNLGGNGDYYILCEALGTGASASVTGAYTAIEVSEKPAYCGGVRVKTITQVGGLDNKDLMKRYDYTVDGKSSGVLLRGFPEYVNTYYRFKEGPIGTILYCDSPEMFECRIVSSNDALPSGQGGIIGYNTVTEIIGPSGQGGRNVYTYTNEISSPGTDISWRQGLLVTKKSYNSNGTLVYSLENAYTIDSRIGQTITGGAIDFLGGHYCAEYNVYRLGFPVYFRVSPLTYTSEWQYLSRTRETFYGVQKDSTAALTRAVTQEYTYGNTVHQQITRTVAYTDNDTEKQITEMRYPGDLLYAPLVTRHQWNVPMQRANLVEKNDMLNLINLENTVYGQQVTSSGVAYLPTQQWRLEQRVPVTYNKSTDPDFIQTYTFAGCQTGVAPPCMRQLITFAYDSKFNPNSLVSSTGIRRGMIWGYAGGLLMANAENASPAEIAYTSFENYAGATELGNWTMKAGTSYNGGKTGEASLSGASLEQSKLPVGQYTVSFYAKGSGAVRIYNGSATGSLVNTTTLSNTNTWQLYRVTMAVSKITTDASLGDIGTTALVADAGVVIDEVRLHPVAARMSTYTHTPGIGVSTITDVNGQVHYYTYDGLNRLNAIRDNDGKILSSYRYGYRKTVFQPVGTGGDQTPDGNDY